MKHSDVTVEVRSAALGRVGAIDLDDIDYLQFSKRFRNVGAWSLTLPCESEAAPLLSQPGRGLVVRGPVGMTQATPEIPPTYAPAASPSQTNLFTNPSFEAASGTVEVRRNLFTNPSIEGTIAPWSDPIKCTPTLGTVGKFGTSSVKMTCTVAGDMIVRNGLEGGANNIPIEAGKTYSVSAYFRAETVARSVNFDYTFVTGVGGSRVGAYNQSALVTETVGEWIRVSFTATVPAGATRLYLLPRVNGVAVGEIHYLDAVMVEKSPTVNPYFDGSVPPKVRRNLSTNPRALLSGSAWRSNNGAVHPVTKGVAVSDHPLGITTAAEAHLLDGLSPNQYIASLYDIDSFVNSPVSRNFGCWVKVNASGYVAKFGIGANAEPTTTPLTANVWTWITTATAYVGYGFLGIYKPSGLATPITDQVWFTGGTCELVPVESFFDGSYSPTQGYLPAWEGTANASPSHLYDGDFTQAWVGTANASESVLTGVGVAGLTGAGDSHRGHSSHWSASGSKALRLIPTSSTGAGYAYVSLTTVPGAVYTILGTCRLAAALTGSLDGRARSMMARATGMADINSGSAPNTAGTTPLSLTFTAPTTSATLFLWNGARLGGGDVWWDDILLVEGAYSGDYFDGSTPDDSGPGYAYSWTGVADASTSKRTVLEVATPTIPAVPSEKIYGVLFSGPVINWVKKASAEDPIGVFEFTGSDDNIHLADALAYADPVNPAATQGQAYDVRSGVAETVARAYVAANIVSGSSQPSRAVPGVYLAPTDQGRGATVTGRARFNVLGGLLSDICQDGGLGFDMVQHAAEIWFDVYIPEDKTNSVIMNIENDQLTSTSYGFSAPTATRATVAGQGEGAARVIIQRTTAESLASETAWGRKPELFKDRRDAETTAELEAEGDAIVTENGKIITSLSVVPADMESEHGGYGTMDYGRDWRLGDLVKVIVDDQALTAVISEAIVTLTAEGISQAATVGEPSGFDFESKIISAQGKQEKRLSSLERSAEQGATESYVDAKTWDASKIVSGVLADARLPARLNGAYNVGSGKNPSDYLENGFYSGYDWVGSLAGFSIGTLLVEQYSPDWISQTFTTVEATPRKYIRSYHNGTTWTAWLQVATTDFVNALVPSTPQVGEWGGKSGPTSWSSAYKNVWSVGRNGLATPVSINALYSTTQIQILQTGQYEVEARQRGAGASTGYVGVAVDGNRATLDARATGIWTHDHSGGSGNFSLSKYIGLLNAGELITAGGSGSSDLMFGAFGYFGMFTVKRIG